MSAFFVRRPIVAIVIAVLTVLIGLVCMISLPVAQYPQIAPPEIVVQTHYTGADALTVEQSVAAPIEQRMSGVDKMNYMTSTNANNGDMRLTVNFDLATDPNTDQILTQLRVSQAQSQLPQDVNNFGVTVQKSVSAPLMLVSLTSPKQVYDGIFLANYAYITWSTSYRGCPAFPSAIVWRRAVRHAAVGETRPAGQARFDPCRKSSCHTGAKYVNPAGKIGSEPIPKGSDVHYTVRAQGRLQTPEEFGEIVVRANPDVRLSA